jgi:hypothetical protein
MLQSYLYHTWYVLLTQKVYAVYYSSIIFYCGGIKNHFFCPIRGAGLRCADIFYLFYISQRRLGERMRNLLLSTASTALMGTTALASSAATWPGSSSVADADLANVLGNNLSGLNYEAEPGSDKTSHVMWGIRNDPSTLYKLQWDASTGLWTTNPLNGWSNGKSLRYVDGTGNPDAEGITRAERSNSIYVCTERNDDGTHSDTSRMSILRYSLDGNSTVLNAAQEWVLNSLLPSSPKNNGLEAITWVPDSYLVSMGFRDHLKGTSYNPSDYPNHGTGLFFVGHEDTAMIYVFALDHATTKSYLLNSFSSGLASIMSLSFDEKNNYLWSLCDDKCNDQQKVYAVGPKGEFAEIGWFNRPAGMPLSNLEGFVFVPDHLCRADGTKDAYWADDSNTKGHAIKSGTVKCGPFLG